MKQPNKKHHKHIESSTTKENSNIDSSIENNVNIQQLIKSQTTESENKLKKIIDQEVIKFNKKNVTKTYNYVSIFISFIVGILVTFVILFVTMSSDITTNANNIQTLKTQTTNQISTLNSTFTHDENLLSQMLSYIIGKKYQPQHK